MSISRTGYSGDLGYEIWIPWSEALPVWDALIAAGEAYTLRVAGMEALDVARLAAIARAFGAARWRPAPDTPRDPVLWTRPA